MRGAPIVRSRIPPGPLDSTPYCSGLARHDLPQYWRARIGVVRLAQSERRLDSGGSEAPSRIRPHRWFALTQVSIDTHAPFTPPRVRRGWGVLDSWANELRHEISPVVRSKAGTSRGCVSLALRGTGEIRTGQSFHLTPKGRRADFFGPRPITPTTSATP